MYVIFPADEVVYLSYGRLIYIPTIASQQVEGVEQPPPPYRQLLTNCTIPIDSTRASVPSTSSLSPAESVRRASSTKSASPQLLVNDQPIRPERIKQQQRKKNSTDSSASKRKPNGSIKPNALTQPSSSPPNNPIKSPPPPPPLKASSTSISLQSAANKPPAPNKPALNPHRDKRLSYSDFLPVHKCLKPDQLFNVQQQAPKSAPSSTGRRTFDFDELFERREVSPVSVRQASPLRTPSPDKFLLKKKPFFLTRSPKPEPRLKRTSEFGISVQKRQQLAEQKDADVTAASGWRASSNMAAAVDTSTLKELTHPHYNELLKGHNGVTFKLIRTVSDFTQQLSQMYEQHAAELQHLVAGFRKRNGELRKERPACASSIFHTWETLLQEVEIDSQAMGDIASILGRQVSRPLLEKSFYRKIQSRKVFTHRESYETIIAKTEEKLVKCRQEYKNAYVLYLSAPSTDTLSGYFNSHNAYVQQLHATNGMLDEYGKETLPQLLQELEEIYTDLCSTLCESVIQGAEVVAARAMEQNRRYEGLITQSKAVNGNMDLVHLARALPAPQGRPPITRRLFVPPQPPPQQEVDGEDGPIISNENIPPPLKDELVIDRLSAVQVKPSHDALRKEACDLDAQIRQIQDALDTLIRLQQRSVEASLFNKANEIQEDISMKRFDLRVAQLHLSAIHAQKELFSSKLENASGGAASDTGRERKMSNASQGSMKTKWLKAFKSLKTPPPETDKKNGSAATRELLKGDPDAHNFQEYTYKKITPCDVCSQVLRGHTKQGLKCRICKMNVHLDCQEKASKCTAKARLLRRQKSTSEIETKGIEQPTTEEESYFDDNYSGMPTINRQLSIRSSSRSPQPLSASPNQQIPPNFMPNSIETSEVDLIYQVLKQAGEISCSKPQQLQQPGQPQPPVVGITLERGATPSSSGTNLNRLGMRPPPSHQPTTPRPQGSNLCVINPAPCSTSSDRRTSQGATSGNAESSMRRRIFAGMKSLTGFGSRSRRGSPGHRSISLPERMRSMRNSSSAGNFYTENGTHSYVAPHSPRRQKLNLRMKSLSLDSPESTEHVQRRKHHGAAATSDPHSNQGSSSRIQFPQVAPLGTLRLSHLNHHAAPISTTSTTATTTTTTANDCNSTPSSPVHNRRLLSAKNIRMSSVELPDDNEKSPSSASTSPCPSPVGGKHKPHRLLPTNLYVVLYNFKSRHQDELDLKAGYKVTVIDTSDPDWWKGKCLGRIGYFPSKYCSKLSPGEKPLQVTHNLQVSDGDNGLMLLRDQIVIQIGEELDGMVMIRSGDNRQGVCPVKFLQEV